ncbi:MAG: hypothetical protein N3D20_00330 [Candidatus Pacearchaeota archaeon]|nr:hypothetical protein [Candidatus Pacearchaeota archaeon]
MQNKKAISEMISYVLLIVIAVVMSVMVYAYIKVYLPKSQPSCQEEINLILNNYVCDIQKGILHLSLTNKGLFKVKGAYIRIGNSTSKTTLNEANQYFYEGSSVGLSPGNTYSRPFKIPTRNFPPGSYNLEIVPIDVINNKAIVCEKAIISQPIECK